MMSDLSSKLKSRTNPQTRCSNCQTVFEVARELLSSNDTRVRCGECLSIFDALEEVHSAKLTTQGQPAARAPGVSGVASSAGIQSATEVPGGLSNETAALDITYSDFDIFSKEADLPEIAYFDQTRDTPDFDFNSVEMGNDETFNDYLFAHDVTIDANSSDPNAGETNVNSLNNKPLTNQSYRDAEHADVDFIDDQQPGEPLIFKYRDRQKPTPVTATSKPASTTDSISSAHGAQAKSIGAPTATADVGIKTNSQTGQAKKNPWVFRIGMFTLLGVLLVALFLYRSRPQLYNNSTLRPMLEMACNIMPCSLPARIDVASLKMVKRNVYSHPSTPNALVINVSFRNDANFAQQLPVLHMVLSNRVGRVVAKQDFLPNYYMPNWREGSVIDANQQLDVKLEVADPGQDAQNFEFHFREFKS